MSDGVVCEEGEKNDLKPGEHKFMTDMKAKMKTVMSEEALDQETTRHVERMIILRVSTKHINLWIRQLEMKRMEMCHLAVLLKIEGSRRRLKRSPSNDGQGDAPITSQRK